MNCSLVPTITLGEAAVTVIEIKIGAVTVKVKGDDEVTPLRLAVMFVTPSLTPVANPCEPTSLLMVAVAVLEEAHVAVLVRSCVEPSE
jgi:hypothetical protein